MSEATWLDYRGQSTEELLSLAATHRTDSIVVAFETGLLEKDADQLSEEERVVLAIEAMEREVNNGGFDQFFVNASGDYAAVIAGYLERIDCPKTAAIAARAVAALGLEPPFTRDDVDEVLREESARRDKELSACDEAYYAGSEDIAGKLLAFIQRNASKIVLP